MIINDGRRGKVIFYRSITHELHNTKYLFRETKKVSFTIILISTKHVFKVNIFSTGPGLVILWAHIKTSVREGPYCVTMSVEKICIIITRSLDQKRTAITND